MSRIKRPINKKILNILLNNYNVKQKGNNFIDFFYFQMPIIFINENLINLK